MQCMPQPVGMSWWSIADGQFFECGKVEGVAGIIAAAFTLGHICAAGCFNTSSCFFTKTSSFKPVITWLFWLSIKVYVYITLQDMGSYYYNYILPQTSDNQDLWITGDRAFQSDNIRNLIERF